MKNILFKVASILIIMVLSIKNGYSVTNYNQIAVSKLKYTISGAYASVAPAYKGIGDHPFYYYYSENHYDVPETVMIDNNEYTVTSIDRKAFTN